MSEESAEFDRDLMNTVRERKRMREERYCEYEKKMAYTPDYTDDEEEDE